MNRTKRVIRVLKKLEKSVIDFDRLNQFMERYHFQNIPYYGNEADNYTRLKFFNGEILIILYARELKNGFYALLHIERVVNENNVRASIIEEIKDSCLNQSYSLIGYEVNDEIMSLGGYDVFDYCSYSDLLQINSKDGYGNMLHCVAYKWFDWDIYEKKWIEKSFYFDVLIEYKIDKHSLQLINAINENENIFYEDIDFEKMFYSGELRVIGVEEN